MSNRRHFHTFDALRFFAFLKVFLLHLPITAFPVQNEPGKAIAEMHIMAIPKSKKVMIHD